MSKKEKEIRLATDKEIERLFNPKRGRPEKEYELSGYKCEINCKDISEFDKGLEQGTSSAKKQMIEIIKDWTFKTMKNFSGIDKDFFKDDVQKLLKEVGKIK